MDFFVGHVSCVVGDEGTLEVQSELVSQYGHRHTALTDSETIPNQTPEIWGVQTIFNKNSTINTNKSHPTTNPTQINMIGCVHEEHQLRPIQTLAHYHRHNEKWGKYQQNSLQLLGYVTPNDTTLSSMLSETKKNKPL